ncbi:MAG: FAD-dependent monooxygenase [Alphaproteobacteria bacterium]|nr:FAD-dependent monooxygenase [Alphaproteobacteria bacterium]
MSRSPRIVIIGAGIAGLSTAVALRRRGIEVAVYEQADAVSEIGAGVQMTPNAMRALRALGVEDAAMAVAFEPESQVLRNWKSGRVIYRAPMRSVFRERFGAPGCSFHRADLLSVLAAPLPSDIIHLGARCVGVETRGRGATARFADGCAAEGDIVVGADGIHSTLRRQMFGADMPRFTGCMCWRGLVPADRIPTGLIERASSNWLGPHGHVVHYYVRRGEMVNFVAIHDTEEWTEESWIREADRDELMATYARWHPDLLRLFECSDRYFKWGLFDRDPLPRWTDGRVTLLGDSAHAMLPFLAQGAAMGIEDGCVLAEVIARSPDDLDGALRAYEALRVPRTRRAVLGSRERAKLNHLPSRWARFKRDLEYTVRRLFYPDGTVHRTAWLYGYDVMAEEHYASLAPAAGEAVAA